MRIQGVQIAFKELSYLFQKCFAQIISTSICFAAEMCYNLIVAEDGKPKHSCVLNLGLNFSHRQTQKMFRFVCFQRKKKKKAEFVAQPNGPFAGESAQLS